MTALRNILTVLGILFCGQIIYRLLTSFYGQDHVTSDIFAGVFLVFALIFYGVSGGFE